MKTRFFLLLLGLFIALPAMAAGEAYNDASCTGSGPTAMCVAVGGSGAYDANALLANSIDGGNTWGLKSITDLPANSTFDTMSCLGSGPTATCMAAGSYLASDSPNRFLFAVSTDGSRTWAVKPMPAAKNGMLMGSSCTGEGAHGVCAMTGAKFLDAAHWAPYIMGSSDGGVTWAQKVLPAAPTNRGALGRISCTGSGSTAICSAVGFSMYDGDVLAPYLAVSTDGANTWDTPTIWGLFASGGFFDTTCVGNGATARCFAVGGPDNGPINTAPFVVASLNGGKDWQMQSVPGLPARGQLRTVHCAGEICVAGGDQIVGDLAPFLMSSVDGGHSWAVKTVPQNIKNSAINAVYCTSGDAAAVCVAAGGQVAPFTTPPLLLVSKDGGDHWKAPVVANLPKEGTFYSAKCTGEGETAVCTAVGQDKDASEGKPLLVTSTDGGETWEVKVAAH